MKKAITYFAWTLQIIAAIILAQTLYFKFTAAPESVYIFSTLGLEPWGRIGSGIAELIAAILLLTPRFAWAGAMLALMVITGALVSHVTKLGIVVMGDHGELFILALIVFFCSVTILAIRRKEIPVIGKFTSRQKISFVLMAIGTVKVTYILKLLS